jgi:hypothetical protein
MELLATSSSRRHCRRSLNTNEIRKDGITSRTKDTTGTRRCRFFWFLRKVLWQFVRLNGVAD